MIQHQQLYAQQNAAGAPERCHAGRWIRLGRPAVARRVRQPHLVTRPEPSFAAAAAATAPCVGAVRVVQRQAACSKAPEPRTLRRGKASLPLRPTSIACPATSSPSAAVKSTVHAAAAVLFSICLSTHLSRERSTVVPLARTCVSATTPASFAALEFATDSQPASQPARPKSTAANSVCARARTSPGTRRRWRPVGHR